jgi:hypothetical protein
MADNTPEAPYIELLRGADGALCLSISDDHGGHRLGDGCSPFRTLKQFPIDDRAMDALRKMWKARKARERKAKMQERQA